MKILWRRHLTLFLGNRLTGGKELIFQGDLIEFRRKRPTKLCSLDPIKVISDVLRPISRLLAICPKRNGSDPAY
jgi:hypothetical protein